MAEPANNPVDPNRADAKYSTYQSALSSQHLQTELHSKAQRNPTSGVSGISSGSILSCLVMNELLVSAARVNVHIRFPEDQSGDPLSHVNETESTEGPEGWYAVCDIQRGQGLTLELTQASTRSVSVARPSAPTANPAPNDTGGGRSGSNSSGSGNWR